MTAGTARSDTSKGNAMKFMCLAYEDEEKLNALVLLKKRK